jgi:hypothetical protein
MLRYVIYETIKDECVKTLTGFLYCDTFRVQAFRLVLWLAIDCSENHSQILSRAIETSTLQQRNTKWISFVLSQPAVLTVAPLGLNVVQIQSVWWIVTSSSILCNRL